MAIKIDTIQFLLHYHKKLHSSVSQDIPY